MQIAIQSLQDWVYRNDGIEKDFVLKNFRSTLDFINQVGELAEKMNHHPDISVKYNKVNLRLTTHDAQAITQKDVELARAIDAI